FDLGAAQAGTHRVECVGVLADRFAPDLCHLHYTLRSVEVAAVQRTRHGLKGADNRLVDTLAGAANRVETLQRVMYAERFDGHDGGLLSSRLGALARSLGGTLLRRNRVSGCVAHADALGASLLRFSH